MLKKILPLVALSVMSLTACGEQAKDEAANDFNLTNKAVGMVISERVNPHVGVTTVAGMENAAGAVVSFNETNTRTLLVGVKPFTSELDVTCKNFNANCKAFEKDGVKYRLTWLLPDTDKISSMTLDAFKGESYAMGHYVGKPITEDPRKLKDLDVSVDQLAEVLADERLVNVMSSELESASKNFKWSE